MAATYNPLTRSELTNARELLGDTAVTPGATTIPEDEALYSDAHILAVLAEKGSFALGVAHLAEALVTQFSQEPTSLTSDGTRIDFSARIPAWQELAERLRAAAVAATPVAQRKPRVGLIQAGTGYKVR